MSLSVLKSALSSQCQGAAVKYHLRKNLATTAAAVRCRAGFRSGYHHLGSGSNLLLLQCRAISSAPGDGQVEQKKPSGIFDRLFGLESNVASEKFTNRWLMTVPAFATQMCIGSPWAWSLMADVISREKGFVAPAAADWTLYQAALPLSMVFLTMGFSSSLFGKWQLKVGARTSMATAAALFGGGIVIGAAGIHLHSLPILYTGYGLMAGIGIGVTYTPPMQALMLWFPDKKGIAAGLASAGFGCGALVFTPCAQYLMKTFSKLPEYVGPADQVSTIVKEGKMFADINGSLVEVVQAGSSELAKLPYTLSEGLYIVGSGSSGAAEALAVMGLAYFSIIMASALSMYRPHPTYIEKLDATMKAANELKVAPIAKVADVTAQDAVKTPQFHLLGSTFFLLATGGMGIMSVAKPMMSEVFSAALPHLVTSAFAAKFVLMLSTGNLGGRLAWAGVSDAIGRRNTFIILTMGSIPLYLSLPTLVNQVLSTGSEIPLYIFCAGTTLAVSSMGASYACMPPYEADLFGTKFVGAIHGRLLLYSSAAALIGPALLIHLRHIAEQSAIADLMSKITPEKFEMAFGAPMTKAAELIEAKTLTISKLLVLCPPGTIDPTPHLYDTTMYTLSGAVATAAVAHLMVRPLSAPKGNVIDVNAVDTEKETSTVKK